MFRPNTGTRFNGGINVGYINIRSCILQQQLVLTSRWHDVFAFLISSLLNFLQLEYQGTGTVSPFQPHPKIMWVAVSSLFLYCFAYAIESRFTQFGRGGMVLFGSILSVSLASVLFQNSVWLALYFLYLLVSNREMLCSMAVVLCSWLHRRMIADPFQGIWPINRRWIGTPAYANRRSLLPL